LIREELDRQVAAKQNRKDNTNKESALYDQIYDEHGKLLEQREKQKADALKQKVLMDKESRDQQLRDEQHRKKKDQINQMNQEKEYINRLRAEME